MMNKSEFFNGNATELSANEFISLLNGGIEEGKLYRVKEKVVLKSGRFCGRGAALIAEGGILVSNVNTLSLTSLAIMGNIEIDSGSKNISIFDCNIKGSIISSAADCIIKACSAESISLLSGSQNCLVAENKLDGDITVSGAYNSSVILNCASGLSACNSKNIYIIDNTLSGALDVKDNKYLICDGNKFSDVKNSNNTLSNGDSIQDVDARLPVGADEELLPHTNKDLFMGMERKAGVTDSASEELISLNEYISNGAKNGDVVIVPPGVYSVSGMIDISDDCSDTVIYAYGAYLEAVDYIKCLQIKGAKNIVLKGLTVGYSKPSAGQMQILDKLDNNRYLCISSAGFMEKFGQLDPDVCTAGGYFFHPREQFSWTEIGYWGEYKVIPNENGEKMNQDGTFVIEVTNRDTSYDFISRLRKGEILTCRIKPIPSDRTASISDSENILLKDTVTYGFSGGLCFVIGGLSRGVQFYRHHNLSHSAYELDKATYDKYKALEEKYDVDLEMHIDEEGRYRGATPRIGSVDATHVTGSSKGLDATSTLFENSCDDATNQNGNSSCLHKIIDNGDGTSTLIIKDSIPWVYYWLYQRRGSEDIQPGITARIFKAGNRIFSYASNGKILCDTTVLTDAEKLEDKHLLYETDYDFKGETKHMRWYSGIYAIKVKTEDLNLSAIDGINPEIADYTMDNKVIVDNISRNSADFIFDNCMVRHNRGRFVIKTHNGTIKNCTFKDTSYAGIVMSCECTWGESSVPRNITVSQCLFDGASRTENQDKNTKYAAIAVEGLGNGEADVAVSEGATLPAQNITVCNNVFKKMTNEHYVTFSAVQGILVKGNVFEAREYETEENVAKAIGVKGCMDIEISDNTYSKFANGDTAKVINARNYINLRGSDVDGKFSNNSAIQN